MRMSRAGRKELMLKVLVVHDKRLRGGALVTAKLAHGAGLMSSTEVVKMLRELANDGKVIEVQIEPSYAAGYTVRAWQLAYWSQMTLPDDYIIINKKMYRRDSGEEVIYVAI